MLSQSLAEQSRAWLAVRGIRNAGNTFKTKRMDMDGGGDLLWQLEELRAFTCTAGRTLADTLPQWLLEAERDAKLLPSRSLIVNGAAVPLVFNNCI